LPEYKGILFNAACTSENEIAPNHIGNWKNVFLENAVNAFDNKK
jgi:hypothetical protein